MGGIQLRYPPSDSRSTRWLILLIFTGAAFPALAQDPRYTNKLAPYVASPAKVVDRMLELANIRPGETVFDLGCGDGRILIEAAQRYKAKAVGIEISPKIAAEARIKVKKAGLAQNVQVIEGDLLQADLTGADVVTIYLATSLNEELRPRLERFLKPGARVVSHDYAVPGWKPTQVVQADGRQKHSIYLYEMPPVKQ
jgi:cyclopropane fatty-acyl-phospholipid synthase-like methyltransferase